jgi:hypothetical protein
MRLRQGQSGSGTAEAAEFVAPTGDPGEPSKPYGRHPKPANCHRDRLMSRSVPARRFTLVSAHPEFPLSAGISKHSSDQGTPWAGAVYVLMTTSHSRHREGGPERNNEGPPTAIAGSTHPARVRVHQGRGS